MTRVKPRTPHQEPPVQFADSDRAGDVENHVPEYSKRSDSPKNAISPISDDVDRLDIGIAGDITIGGKRCKRCKRLNPFKTKPPPNGASKERQLPLTKGRKWTAESDKPSWPLDLPDPLDPLEQEPWHSSQHNTRQNTNGSELLSSSGRKVHMRQSVRARCILPLLWQLEDAEGEGARSSNRLQPGLHISNYARQQEMWTCGQNSYGELGHSDTGTRKNFCLVKTLGEKDVLDIAAGQFGYAVGLPLSASLRSLARFRGFEQSMRSNIRPNFCLGWDNLHDSPSFSS